jgi:hypothetical protein
MNEILTQVWSCLVQSSEIYSLTVVNSDSYESKNDSISDPEGYQLIA